MSGLVILFPTRRASRAEVYLAPARPGCPGPWAIVHASHTGDVLAWQDGFGSIDDAMSAGRRLASEVDADFIADLPGGAL